jgi:hypothetical protein
MPPSTSGNITTMYYYYTTSGNSSDYYFTFEAINKTSNTVKWAEVGEIK